MQFAILLILMLLTSFTEILTIGAVLPFLAILTAPDTVFLHPIAQPLIQGMGFTSADQLLLPLTVSFGFMALVAGAMRLLLLWANTRVSYATGADLSISIYERTLYQPYFVHVSRNSSEIITGVSTKIASVINVITMLLNLISSGVLLVAILLTLLYLEPFVALVAFGGYGTIYGIIVLITRGRQFRNGERIARESTRLIKCLQEGLGGIRDVLIDGSQSTYCQIFRNADQPLRNAQASSTFISASPRFGMEAFGIVLIALLAYILSRQPEGISRAIPILGALALGAQRLLPVLQHAYSSWSTIQVTRASLHDALELLDQPLPEHGGKKITASLPFKEHLKLKDMSFRYNAKTTWILKDLELTISKGSRVGFIGATGSGKSTLLDIIMGLLQPTSGTLEIDGQIITQANNRNWQEHIAHVPQAIFLADSSIEKNIAFGVDENQIDHDRVRQAASQAQIAEDIDSWPKQYETEVGERGVRLSGGQRQRIGIARALYKKADVIIFDEATSALDNDTERAVMKVIQGLSEDITILIIAHRLSTLRDCTQIVEVRDCGIAKKGTYKDIVGSEIEVEND